MTDRRLRRSPHGPGAATALSCVPAITRAMARRCSLHGLTRNSRDFEPFAEQYAGRFRIIAPDFRGRGLSDWEPDPSRYVPATYAVDVLALLDELAIDQAIFVGTSLGGLVTMVVAAIQPQRISGAILNDVGPELDERGLERIRGYVGRQQHFANWEQAGEYVAHINDNLPGHFSQADWIERARRICREEDGSIVLAYDMAIAEAFQAPVDAAAIASGRCSKLATAG